MTVGAEKAAEWWAQHGKTGSRPSFLQLIANNTVDLRAAAVLWLLVERRASIIVAAEPDLVAKTNLLMALIDLIPPWYEQVYLKGRDENFSFVGEADPEKTYVLVPEFSNQTPAFIWGKSVLNLFRALDGGYSVLSTMRADSPEEVLASLEGKSLKVPKDLANKLHVVANVRKYQATRSPSYRVGHLALIGEQHEPRTGRLTTLAGWDPDTDTFMHMQSQSTVASLAGRLGMDAEEVDEDLVRRSRRLEGWLGSGSNSVGAVRRVLASYYDGLQQA